MYFEETRLVITLALYRRRESPALCSRSRHWKHTVLAPFAQAKKLRPAVRGGGRSRSLSPPPSTFRPPEGAQQHASLALRAAGRPRLLPGSGGARPDRLPQPPRRQERSVSSRLGAQQTGAPRAACSGAVFPSPCRQIDELDRALRRHATARALCSVSFTRIVLRLKSPKSPQQRAAG